MTAPSIRNRLTRFGKSGSRPAVGFVAGSRCAGRAGRGAGPSPRPSRLLPSDRELVCNLFGIGRPRGEVLTNSQHVARNVARAVDAGVATQGGGAREVDRQQKCGNISKAVVRGALGGVLRR